MKLMEQDLEGLIGESSLRDNRTLLRRAFDFSSRYINYKLGLVAGTISGGIVYFMNDEHGFWPGVGAAATEFAYNVIASGIATRLCENFAKRISSKTSALVSSSVAPVALGFAMNYSFHEVFSTPDAFQSSIWKVPINLPIFLGLGIYYRNKLPK